MSDQSKIDRAILRYEARARLVEVTAQRDRLAEALRMVEVWNKRSKRVCILCGRNDGSGQLAHTASCPMVLASTICSQELHPTPAAAPVEGTLTPLARDRNEWAERCGRAEMERDSVRARERELREALDGLLGMIDWNDINDPEFADERTKYVTAARRALAAGSEEGGT